MESWTDIAIFLEMTQNLSHNRKYREKNKNIYIKGMGQTLRFMNNSVRTELSY